MTVIFLKAIDGAFKNAIFCMFEDEFDKDGDNMVVPLIDKNGKLCEYEKPVRQNILIEGKYLQILKEYSEEWLKAQKAHMKIGL